MHEIRHLPFMDICRDVSSSHMHYYSLYHYNNDSAFSDIHVTLIRPDNSEDE